MAPSNPNHSLKTLGVHLRPFPPALGLYPCSVYQITCAIVCVDNTLCGTLITSFFSVQGSTTSGLQGFLQVWWMVKKNWGLLEIIRNWKLEGKKTQITPNPWPNHTARSPKIFKENQGNDNDSFRRGWQQIQLIFKQSTQPYTKTELKLIHFTWKRNRKSCGCPGRQCLFKLRNTSLTKFDPLYPILEPWHKVQSSSQGEG